MPTALPVLQTGVPILVGVWETMFKHKCDSAVRTFNTENALAGTCSGKCKNYREIPLSAVIVLICKSANYPGEDLVSARCWL